MIINTIYLYHLLLSHAEGFLKKNYRVTYKKNFRVLLKSFKNYT